MLVLRLKPWFGSVHTLLGFILISMEELEFAGTQLVSFVVRLSFSFIVTKLIRFDWTNDFILIGRLFGNSLGEHQHSTRLFGHSCGKV
jgi:hypothetical protein